MPRGTAQGDPGWSQTHDWSGLSGTGGPSLPLPPPPSRECKGVLGGASQEPTCASECLRPPPPPYSRSAPDRRTGHLGSSGCGAQPQASAAGPAASPLSSWALTVHPHGPAPSPGPGPAPSPDTDLSPGCSQQGHPASPNPRLCCPSMGGRGGQLTVEAAHIQCHAGLLLGGCPLKMSRREGAGSPRDHGLHEAMLTHGLEATPPVIRHKPGG